MYDKQRYATYQHRHEWTRQTQTHGRMIEITGIRLV